MIANISDRKEKAEKALRTMVQARCQLMLAPGSTCAFFASLALRLQLQANWACPTASTDGKFLLFNPDYILGLRAKYEQAKAAAKMQRTPAPKDPIQGLIVHEVLHCTYNHFARLGARDRGQFNVAADLTINQIIMNIGFTLPEGCLLVGQKDFASFPVNQSAEAYYELIKKLKEQQQQQPEEQDDECPDEPEEAQDESESANDSDEGEEESPEESDGDSGDDSEDAEDDGGAKESSEGSDGNTVDDQLSPDAEGSQEGEGDGGQSEGSGSGDGEGTPQDQSKYEDPGSSGGFHAPEKASPADLTEQEADWKQAVHAAAQAAKSKGDLPSDIARMVEDMLKSETSWQDELSKFVNAKCKSDYSWKRPNTRFAHQGLHLPSLYSDELGWILITFDTSGSIGQKEISVFSGEALSIMECLPVGIKICYHHSHVYKRDEWRPSDGPYKVENILTGGTSHAFLKDEVLDMETPPVCIICLTDCLTDTGEDPGVPVLWACTSDVKSMPFGEVLPIKL